MRAAAGRPETEQEAIAFARREELRAHQGHRHVGSIMLRAARRLAAGGLRVFPLRAAPTKERKQPDGTLVPHGVKQATTDAMKIRAWWRRSPRAGVGVACGSGLLV